MDVKRPGCPEESVLNKVVKTMVGLKFLFHWSVRMEGRSGRRRGCRGGGGRFLTRARAPQMGWTPLHATATHDSAANEAVARMLLAAGADARAKAEKVSGWGGLGDGRAHTLFLFSWRRRLTAASVLTRVGEMSTTIDTYMQARDLNRLA